jgi:hypothetical protein
VVLSFASHKFVMLCLLPHVLVRHNNNNVSLQVFLKQKT